MSTNSHHASFLTNEYKWKDFNHGPTRDLTSEKNVETSNANFKYNDASRNSPLSSRNQSNSRKDNNSTNHEPLQVKHLQNQQHYHEFLEEESEENDIPPQPIINDKTLLALEYLQKHLIPNKIRQQEKNVPPHIVQDGGSEGFPSHNESNERDGKECISESKNGITELNKRAKDSSYLTNSDKYERSRSRSSEKNDSYDRRQIQRNSYDERYKPYKNKVEEDWECLNCRATNWARRDNCSKCGYDRIENNPRGMNKNKSPERKGLDFHKDQYYKSESKRNGYRNTSTKNGVNNFSSTK